MRGKGESPRSFLELGGKVVSKEGPFLIVANPAKGKGGGCRKVTPMRQATGEKKRGGRKGSLRKLHRSSPKL